MINSGKTSLSAETATIGMRRFVADLGVGVAYDTVTLVIQVGGPQCAKWGISPEEAHAIALDNLRHKAAPSFQEVIPGTYVAAYGDHYDATRILLPELAWQLQLNCNPVAMIPTRQPQQRFNLVFKVRWGSCVHAHTQFAISESSSCATPAARLMPARVRPPSRC